MMKVYSTKERCNLNTGLINPPIRLTPFARGQVFCIRANFPPSYIIGLCNKFPQLEPPILKLANQNSFLVE